MLQVQNKNETTLILFFFITNGTAGHKTHWQQIPNTLFDEQ